MGQGYRSSAQGLSQDCDHLRIRPWGLGKAEFLEGCWPRLPSAPRPASPTLTPHPPVGSSEPLLLLWPRHPFQGRFSLAVSSPKGGVPGCEPWRKPVGHSPLLGRHCGHQMWLERHLPLRTAAPNTRGFGKRGADLCLAFGCCLAVPCGAVLPMGLTRQRARVAGLQIGVSAGCRLATPRAWGHPAALICPERAVEHFLQPHPLCHARQGWACDAACS